MRNASSSFSENEYTEFPNSVAGWNANEVGETSILRGSHIRLSSDNYLSATDRLFAKELDAATRISYIIDSTRILSLVNKLLSGEESFE